MNDCYKLGRERIESLLANGLGDMTFTDAFCLFAEYNSVTMNVVITDDEYGIVHYSKHYNGPKYFSLEEWDCFKSHGLHH